MEWVILFAGMVLARVQSRAVDDVGDRIYDTIGSGLDLFKKWAAASRSGNKAAAKTAADEYAAHLDKHPEEAVRVLPAIVDVVARTEPLVVLAALTHVLCLTAAKVQQRPLGAGPAGCVAFTGSFVNPSVITVIDVRDSQGVPLPSPEITTEDGSSYLEFPTPLFRDSIIRPGTAEVFQVLSQPRMWIVKPHDPLQAEALAGKLNDVLLDRVDRPAPSSASKKVHELISTPIGDSTQALGYLRFVDKVYADRIAINYPDHVRHEAHKAARTLTESSLVSTLVTEVDKLALSERREFFVSAVDGPRALFSSLQAMAQQDQDLLSAWRNEWGSLGGEAAAR